MTGALVPAQEALAAGLVSELVPADQLEERARALALEIAANCSPVALALTRRMLWHFSGQDGPQGALAVDAPLNIALGAGADVHEGVAAFLEKRPPQFPLSVSQNLPPMPWWPANPTGYR
jgi:enoyl-CoA hydratase/carnithine racemase